MTDRSTILIVDDKASGRKILGDLLQAGGGSKYRLYFADSGEAALKQARHLMPDLILLDVMMPGMNGFEVCRHLRADEHLAEVPVMMITALDDEESLLEGIAAGADDFISKPFNHTEIRVRVQTITRLNRYRRLLTERTKFEWVVTQAEDGYLVLDHDDTIRQANPQARLYLDLPQDEQPTHEPFLHIVWHHYEFHPTSAWQNWPEPSPKVRYLIRPETSTANAFWLQVDILDLPDGPDPTRMVRLRDVTEQMVLQYDVRGFHNLIRHKLRSPLTGVLTNTEILAQNAPTMNKAEIIEFIQSTLTSARRLHGEIEDILQYLSAMEMSQPGSYLHLSGLKSLVTKIRHSLGLERVMVEIAEGLQEQSLPLSPQAAELVLWEVLENAHKFHPQHKPTIEITVHPQTPGQVSLCIADDGLVLSPEQLANAWRPYYQGEKYFTGEAEGMGLGLSLVATLVWRVGGSVHIYNRQPEPGVVVELVIPLVNKKSPVPPKNTGPSSGGEENRER